MQQGKPYHWKDWCIARGRDCLYIWSDAAALELSNGSNGWFRFILDSKLATMYSSGSPEGGSDSSGSRGYDYYFKFGILRWSPLVTRIWKIILNSPKKLAVNKKYQIKYVKLINKISHTVFDLIGARGAYVNLFSTTSAKRSSSGR